MLLSRKFPSVIAHISYFVAMRGFFNVLFLMHSVSQKYNHFVEFIVILFGLRREEWKYRGMGRNLEITENGNYLTAVLMAFRR